jgi:hypothetical protein
VGHEDKEGPVRKKELQQWKRTEPAVEEDWTCRG